MEPARICPIEPYRVYRRAYSLRGWVLWHDTVGIPPRCESGPSGCFTSPRRSIPPRGPRWASIAGKLGCTPETLRTWVRQAERDAGQRGGLTTDERQRVKELEREVRELKRANEILRKASAFFAQAELDRRPR